MLLRLRPDHRHILDGHVGQVCAELDLDVELEGALVQLRDKRGAVDLWSGIDIHGPPQDAVSKLLNWGNAHLGDVVAMPHGPHRPIGMQQQVPPICVWEAQKNVLLIAPVTLTSTSSTAKATIDLNVPKGASLGTFPVTFTGTSGTVVHRTTVSLRVK